MIFFHDNLITVLLFIFKQPSHIGSLIHNIFQLKFDPKGNFNIIHFFFKYRKGTFKLWGSLMWHCDTPKPNCRHPAPYESKIETQKQKKCKPKKKKSQKPSPKHKPARNEMSGKPRRIRTTAELEIWPSAKIDQNNYQEI